MIRNRVRRFVVTAVAATLSILAISHSAQAYDQICINGQCGHMTPVRSSQVNYQSEDGDPGVQWTQPLPQQEPKTRPIEETHTQSAPEPPPVQQSSVDCGIYFHPLVPQSQRTAVCQAMEVPDLKGTIASVDASLTDSEYSNERQTVAATADAKNRRILIYKTAIEKGAQGFNEGNAIHEAAHNKADEIYGSTMPLQDSEFYQAWQQEKGVSEYASRNAQEGFAEAYRMSVEGDRTLDQFPLQKAAIERIRNGGNG